MAFVNPNKPAGLSPVKWLNAGKYNGQGSMYAIAAADTNGYWPGDVVKLVGACDASTGLTEVILAGAADPMVGVILAVGPGTNSVGASGQGGGAGGPLINVNNLSNTNRPAAAQTAVWYCLVEDDPNVIFEIQEGGTGTNLTAASGHGNGKIVYAAPATGVVVSGTMLDNATVGTGNATYMLKLYSFAQRIDNHFVTSPTTGGGYQKWWVIPNNHYYKGGTGTAGL
jgi:hypothetical protein